MVSFKAWSLYPQCKMPLRPLKGLGWPYQALDTLLKEKSCSRLTRTQRFLSHRFLTLVTVPNEVMGHVVRICDSLEGEIIRHTVLRSCTQTY